MREMDFSLLAFGLNFENHLGSDPLALVLREFEEVIGTM